MARTRSLAVSSADGQALALVFWFPGISPNVGGSTNWLRRDPHSCVASERRFVSSQIGGVLVRLPRISAEELRHIEAADREYVASEMTAFLAVWLSSLSCPVLNRPAPDCLFGSNWRPEHWVRLAAQVGLLVRPARREVPSTAVRSKTRKGYCGNADRWSRIGASALPKETRRGARAGLPERERPIFWLFTSTGQTAIRFFLALIRTRTSSVLMFGMRFSNNLQLALRTGVSRRGSPRDPSLRICRR